MLKHKQGKETVGGEVAIEPVVAPDDHGIPRVNDLIGGRLTKLASLALPIAGVGALLTLAGLVLSPRTWFQSYLYAFMFWFGITLGSQAWLMGHHVTGGGWGYLIRRPLEAATRLWPFVIAMWVPIGVAVILSSLVDPHDFAAAERPIYEWANLGFLREDVVLAKKIGYLNVLSFFVRAIIYFVIWMGLAHFLNKLSRQEDASDSPLPRHKLNLISAGGLVLYVLTITFASIDWVMTLEPHWFSSLWGVIFLVGQGLSTMALMIILVRFLGRGLPLLEKVETRYLRDLGNFLLAFTLLWAYMNFSQFMIQYSANIAEEAEWFVHRTTFGWQFWGAANIVLHFALPFFFLLMSINKVNFDNLVKVAALIVFARFTDLFFYVVPTFRQYPTSGFPGGEAPWAFLADFGTPLLLGGLWLWLWVGQMKKTNAPIVPVHDERLKPYWPLAEAHDEAHEQAHGDAHGGHARGEVIAHG